MASTINLNARRLADVRDFEDAVPERTRRITPEAGRALEILGHAIEYLTDEYVNETNELTAADSQVSAISLLMSLNRQVYFDCPTVPTLGERVLAWQQELNRFRLW